MLEYVDGNRMSVEAILEWLVGLPADFTFNRGERRYSCDCLVGRYLNREEEGPKYALGYTNLWDEVGGEYLGELPHEVAHLIHLFDELGHGCKITAGELRRRLAQYWLSEVLDEAGGD